MDDLTRVMATFTGDYEGLLKFGAYLGIFQGLATQLKDVGMAHEWYLMGVTAEDAAKWANGGSTPTGAKPLIAAGITPEMEADADEAGGSVLERIARLADAGIDTKGADLSALDEK
jgi:hypothetical protein